MRSKISPTSNRDRPSPPINSIAYFLNTKTAIATQSLKRRSRKNREKFYNKLLNQSRIAPHHTNSDRPNHPIPDLKSLQHQTAIALFTTHKPDRQKYTKKSIRFEVSDRTLQAAIIALEEKYTDRWFAIWLGINCIDFAIEAAQLCEL